MGLRVIDEIVSLAVDITRVVTEVRPHNRELADQLRRAWCRVACGTGEGQLLCVVLAGDARLVERLRRPELLPLGSHIRRRLVLDNATRDELLTCLDHLLETAGNPSLMTTELKTTLADHAAGNYRIMMNLADELLATAVGRDLARLDEKLSLDTFTRTPKKKPQETPSPGQPMTLRPMMLLDPALVRSAPELTSLETLTLVLQTALVALTAAPPCLECDGPLRRCGLLAVLRTG